MEGTWDIDEIFLIVDLTGYPIKAYDLEVDAKTWVGESEARHGEILANRRTKDFFRIMPVKLNIRNIGKGT